MPQSDQFLLNLEYLWFGAIHQEELLRMVGSDLAAEFAADAAPSAGDKDDPVLQHKPNVLGLQLNSLTAEQVLHLDVSQLAYFDLPQRQLVKGGNRLTLQT